MLLKWISRLEGGGGAQIPAKSTWHLFSFYHESVALLGVSRWSRDRTPTLFTWSRTRKILGAFENCEKLLLASSCLSVHLSVRPSVRMDPAITGRIFMKFDIWVFSKICWENLMSTKIWQVWWSLYMKINMRFWSYLAQFFLECEMFQTNVFRENQNTFYVLLFFFFFENLAVYETM